MLALILVGCSTEVKEIDLEDVSGKVIDTFYQDMIKLDEDEMEAYYLLDSKLQTCVAYISTTQVNHELVMCKGEEIDEIYVNHIDDVKRSVKSYFPEQLEMIDKAVHEKIEDTWVLVIHENQEEIVDFINQQ